MFRIKLKELRENKGLSQSAFAEELGFSQSTVGNWESGTREPKMDVLIKIANYFNVTVDYLLGNNIVSVKQENSSDSLEGIDKINIEINTECSDLPYEAKEKVLSYIRFLKQGE